MPVQSFSISEIIPNLVSGLITYIPDVYQETFGLSGMAKEAKPQLEPKIAIRGKVYKRYVASDIPEASEATMIKDTKFTDEFFTAPEYGRGFPITTEDLIRNVNYIAGFQGMTVQKDRVPTLMERIKNAADMCVNEIKRSADMQVKNILDSGTVNLVNYTTIDFDRDNNNSVSITTANLKWTLANAATMTPLKNFGTWTEQVATRGNSGGQEFFALMESTYAYNAMVNSNEWKADSDLRRNYNIQQLQGITSKVNKNIPEGALYRYTLLSNPAGPVHIFTYDQTYDVNASTQAKWLDANKVYIIAGDNVIMRQPVKILTMNDFIAQSAVMKQTLNATPSMDGWLITPEWNKITARSISFGIYRKYLTIPLTPNKTFTAIVNS